MTTTGDGNDQVVPYKDSAPLSADLGHNGTLKTYEGAPGQHLPAVVTGEPCAS